MSRVFETFIDDLSEKSNYDYDFLIDTFNEIMDEDGDIDIDYFVGVTMEHDW